MMFMFFSVFSKYIIFIHVYYIDSYILDICIYIYIYILTILFICYINIYVYASVCVYSAYSLKDNTDLVLEEQSLECDLVT